MNKSTSRDCVSIIIQFLVEDDIISAIALLKTCKQLQQLIQKNKLFNIKLNFLKCNVIPYNCGMHRVSGREHKDLVEIFMSKGVDDCNFMTKGIDGCNWGMWGAATGGHKDIVEFFISKGANLNWGMACAARGGHDDLVEFFKAKTKFRQ